MRRLERTVLLFTIAIAAPMGTAVFAAQHLAVTFSNSLPPGIYWKSPLPPRGPALGTIVTACVPDAYARFGHAHGFLATGLCDGTEQILKIVEARPGDRVVLSNRGVDVNGSYLPGSTPVARTATGIVLPHVPFRTYILDTGEYWLGTPKANGYDSRYFGPVHTLLEAAHPLVTFDV